MLITSWMIAAENRSGLDRDRVEVGVILVGEPQRLRTRT